MDNGRNRCVWYGPNLPSRTTRRNGRSSRWWWRSSTRRYSANGESRETESRLRYRSIPSPAAPPSPGPAGECRRFPCSFPEIRPRFRFANSRAHDYCFPTTRNVLSTLREHSGQRASRRCSRCMLYGDRKRPGGVGLGRCGRRDAKRGRGEKRETLENDPNTGVLRRTGGDGKNSRETSGNDRVLTTNDPAFAHGPSCKPFRTAERSFAQTDAKRFTGPTVARYRVRAPVETNRGQAGSKSGCDHTVSSRIARTCPAD